MKKLYLTMFIIISLVSKTMAQYSGGDGTSQNPYQIANLADLIHLSETSGDWHKYFIQTSDIDASATSTINEGFGYSPIGNKTINFTGNYNGNNFKISHLFINRPSSDSVGFFGFASAATITNLTIENANITGKSFVGILAGRTFSGTVTNCHTSGNVSAKATDYGRCGGLIGSNGAQVIGCSSSATVSADKDIAGGLIGMCSGSVTECYANGIVSGQKAIGGLIGRATAGTISKCYSSCIITGTEQVGGLVGNAQIYNQINNSYSQSTITDNNGYTGGFVGLVNSDNVVISKCYASTTIGNITGYSFVGGFA